MIIKRFLRFIGDNFIAGILVLLPAFLTFLILRFLIIKLNAALFNPILKYLGDYLPLMESQRIFLAKTLIFIFVILVIVMAGVATRIFIVRRFFSIFEKILSKLPMINKIYGSTKEIRDAFMGKQKGTFKKVVLIEYPRKGSYAIAFITSEVNDEANKKAQKHLMGVYVPTTPNPATGLFLYVPQDEIIPLDMSIELAMKIVISGGLINSPPNAGR